MNSVARTRENRGTQPLSRTRDMVGSLWGNLVNRRRTSRAGDFPVSALWPSLEVSEDEKAVRVTVEAPGLSPKDLAVSLADGALRIRWEKKLEREDKQRDCHCRESWYGSFDRIVPIEAKVDGSKAKADYKNGILKITIPKKTGSSVKKWITIT